jgi:DNA invertase Pin-like site-specific DNA recombinase
MTTQDTRKPPKTTVLDGDDLAALIANWKLPADAPLGVGYCRLSTPGDIPLDRQEADILGCFKARGVRPIAIIRENASAWKPDVTRDGYMMVLDLVEFGTVRVVGAYADDRLWRQSLEQQMFVPVAQKGGLDLVMFATGRDFNPHSDDDCYMQTVLSAGAQKQSADTARRVRRANLHLARKGLPMGGPRAFGFKGGDVRTDTPHNILHDEREAEAIRDAYRRLLADLTGLFQLIEEWNADGLLTPKGNLWTTAVLRKMLLGPRNAGLRVHQGEVFGKAAWEPIVSVEDWEALNRKMALRRRGPRPATTLLGGLLTCGRCGGRLNSMSASREGKRVRVYRCNRKPLGCARVMVRAERVEDFVLDRFFEVVESEFFLRVLSRREADTGAATTARIVEALDADRVALEELRYDYYQRRSMSRRAFLDLEDSLLQRIEVATRQLNAVDPRLAETRTLLSEPARVRGNWDEWTVDEKRRALTLVFESIVVNPGPRGRWEPVGNRVVAVVRTSDPQCPPTPGRGAPSVERRSA